MAESVKRVDYYYTEVPDKAGEGARVLNLLSEHGANLLAVNGFPLEGSNRAQLDFIPVDANTLMAAAGTSGVKLTGPKTAFLIEGADRAGALAVILDKLAQAHISVTAVQATASGAGRFGAVLWVKPSKVQQAAAVLGAL